MIGHLLLWREDWKDDWSIWIHFLCQSHNQCQSSILEPKSKDDSCSTYVRSTSKSFGSHRNTLTTDPKIKDSEEVSVKMRRQQNCPSFFLFLVFLGVIGHWSRWGMGRGEFAPGREDDDDDNDHPVQNHYIHSRSVSSSRCIERSDKNVIGDFLLRDRSLLMMRQTYERTCSPT